MGNNHIYEIGKEFYLIKSTESDLHRNIFVKRFVNQAGDVRSMVFDPGTKLDLPILLETLKKLIGGIQNLDFVFLSHQDPDVTANINMILTSAPKSVVLASIDTWRLVRMYGLPNQRFIAVENLKSQTVKIKKTGHSLRFVPAPFAHFKGALMVYDYESDILFSGDLFSGLNTRPGEGIYADAETWKGVALFHQIYMPANQVIKNAIGQIGMLDKLPGMIAPQHGDMVKEPLVKEYMDRLLALDVGIDIIDRQKADKELILFAFNDFFEKMKHSHGALHKKMLGLLQNPGDFTTLFNVAADMIVDVKVSVEEAVTYTWGLLKKEAPRAEFSALSALFFSSLEEFGLVVPEAIYRELPSPANDGELLV